MSKTLFNEEQKFSHPWVWLIIFPVIGSIIYLASYYDDDGGLDLSTKGGQIGMIILATTFFVMMLGLTTLFYKMKLITQIKRDGIYIKFPPIINKFRFISKKEINRYEIIKYKIGKGYRGRGVNRGTMNNSRTYTVSGKIGLQIYLKDGKKVLIGTQRKEAINTAMQKMMTGIAETGNSLKQ